MGKIGCGIFAFKFNKFPFLPLAKFLSLKYRNNVVLFKVMVSTATYLFVSFSGMEYRSGTVNSKSFVGKVMLRIKWKFELTLHIKHEMIEKLFKETS